MSDKRERFFAQKHESFREAFPSISELEVNVEETDMVETQRTMTYNIDSLPGGELRCSNDNCKNGGVYIDMVISDMVRQEKTNLETRERCKGHEPVGRNESQSCPHTFNLDIEIGYED